MFLLQNDQQGDISITSTGLSLELKGKVSYIYFRTYIKCIILIIMAKQRISWKAVSRRYYFQIFLLLCYILQVLMFF